MPHYNRDSSNFYYGNAIAKLGESDVKNFDLLAQVYRNWCDYDTKHFSFSELDSIAATGWKYAENLKENEQSQAFLYAYLVNWSRIKLDIGDLDTSFFLFTKALSTVENNTEEELNAYIAMNKGWFYVRYSLNTDADIIIKSLYQSLNFYEKISAKQYHLEQCTIYKSLIGIHINSGSDSVFHYLDKERAVLIHNKNPLIHAWYYSVYGRQLKTVPARGEKSVRENREEEAEENILIGLKILEEYQIHNNPIEPYCNGLLVDIYQKKRVQPGHLFL
jgi:hypothetical protein